jgi:ATP-binding cassette subfamily C protein
MSHPLRNSFRHGSADREPAAQTAAGEPAANQRPAKPPPAPKQAARPTETRAADAQPGDTRPADKRATGRPATNPGLAEARAAQQASAKQPKKAPAAPKPQTTGLLASLRRELIRAFVFAGIVTLFVNLGLLFVPIYDMILYDRVLQSKNMDTVTMLTIGVSVAMVIYGALEFCRSAIFVVMADRLARRLNLRALEAAIKKSLEGSSSVAAQAMRDLNELRLFVSGAAAAVPLDLIWTPALVAVLFLLHPAYGVYGLLCAAFLFVLSLITDLSTREDLVRANGETAKSMNDLSAALRNTELLDGMGMLPTVARRWSQRQQQTLDDLKRATRRSKALATTAKAARLAMQGGIIALGTILVLRYEATPGSMMGSNLLVAKLLLPFEQLVSGWRQWTSALAAWGRVRDLVGAAPPDSGHTMPDRIEGRLVLEHASFTPAGATKHLIADVSLAVEPGEAIGIVGPSGSGKSTLARLMIGIFAPTTGAIRLDGVATSEWDRTALAQHAGYLPQSISLLDGTILDNIARMQDSDPAQVIAAATQAGVHDVIGRLPEGYSTWIGGAGYALSGGQQQRVALARALFGAPKLLVLDEPNANLDHVGEQSLVETIEAAKRAGAAVVLITHRPTILAAVDRIVMIKEGRIEAILRTEDYLSSNHKQLDAPAADAGPQGQLASA